MGIGQDEICLVVVFYVGYNCVVYGGQGCKRGVLYGVIIGVGVQVLILGFRLGVVCCFVVVV